MQVSKINLLNYPNSWRKVSCSSSARNVSRILINCSGINDTISFTGKSSKKAKSNIADAAKDCGVVGLSFLLSMTTSIAMAKMGDKAANLLCPKDGFKVSEDGISSKLVDIDLDDHKIEFKGTGIKINADDYDISDWSHGIFKNYDGSVDIDLLHNKFIDVKNGIFIDPEERISAIVDGNKIQSIAIPTFGSGYPTNDMDARSFIHPDRTSEVIQRELNTPLRKISNFINNIFNKNEMPNVDNMEDIYGNNIILAKDNDGDQYFASSMKGIDENELFAPFIQKYGKENVVEAINQQMLKQYIEEKYPSFGTRLRIYEGGRGRTIHDEDIAADTHHFYVNPLTADLNKNNIPDYLEQGMNSSQAMVDANHNHIPDILEGDSNRNGIKDFWEIDENHNHIPDVIENFLKNIFNT